MKPRLSAFRKHTFWQRLGRLEALTNFHIHPLFLCTALCEIRCDTLFVSFIGTTMGYFHIHSLFLCTVLCEIRCDTLFASFIGTTVVYFHIHSLFLCTVLCEIRCDTLFASFIELQWCISIFTLYFCVKYCVIFVMTLCLFPL